ncbi:uncharacterized protein LOC129572413 isoform X2 [Sitodiplosis mosellana]|nr:uncharacterized protein LOC129572413 isoform X2 [Sitodiplosis mosellana]
MGIKHELWHEEMDSPAHFENQIRDLYNTRQLLLSKMTIQGNYKIQSSKVFLANMKRAINKQNNFISKFGIAADRSMDRKLKIASRGWYKMIRNQLYMHGYILKREMYMNQHKQTLLDALARLQLLNDELDGKLVQECDARFP